MQESRVQSEMDARVNQRQPLVELKNGKVILKQKIVSFEKQSETLQGIFLDWYLGFNSVCARNCQVSCIPRIKD